MNIDRIKHQKTELDNLESAIQGVERIYDEAINLVKDNDLKEIIEIAVRWYEEKDIKDNCESLLYYTFFDEAFPTTLGPSHFYGSLASFLANCLLDDSYYELNWKKYNSDTGSLDTNGKPWKDKPCVVWGDDKHGSQNSHTMLEAMKFAIKKEKEREALFNECEKLKEKYHEQQTK